MWQRSILKERAKNVLRNGKYWTAFAVSLVATLLCGLGVGASSTASNNTTHILTESGGGGWEYLNPYAMFATLGLMLGVIAVVYLFIIAYSTFVAGPITVGQKRYYMENRLGDAPFVTLFSSFKKQYMSIVQTLFMRNLFVFFWSLLLYVPGIIKYFEYCMVDYIMAENPSLPWRRALEISRAMTDGEKGSIFIMNLSFIGWNLLGLLACGLGTFFVTPYREASFAELYQVMRDKALSRGLATPQELPGFAAPQPEQI